ncbi:MAG: DUF4178 domain-containing protein [Chloroflexi bacterium]|nr:DUF4178 domain-containing protein [Chloroflexota bacterium]
MQKLRCTSCGADLEVENQFIRSVTCAYCGANYMISGSQTLDPKGKTATLADYPSRLNVGARGTIRGRAFHVLGRIRYTYDAGFWEEWQIAWDDEQSPPDWLEEDEGMWTLYRRGRIKAAIPPYEEVRVGTSISINQQNVFITEKRKGQVAGSEGQFSSVFPISGEFGYVTGAGDKGKLSVNYWQDEIELSRGDEIEFNDLVIK